MCQGLPTRHFGSMSFGVDISGGGDGQVSGEGSHGQTMTQLMRTMYSSAPLQKILLQGNDDQNSFSVYGRDVEVILGGSPGGDAGSNKVKITPVVNYDWESKYYFGNLIAVHRDNQYVAYVLKGKVNGVVRVLHRKNADRILLKYFDGVVVDVAFAHTDEILLAAVDEMGNVFVYDLAEKNSKIISSVVLHVKRPSNSLPSEYHRIIWCPYIPEDCDESMTDVSTQDASRVFVVTHNEQAEIWSVDMVTKEYGSGPLLLENVDNGVICISSHTKAIVDAAFSPDGTALATASLDGEVKFFQVYMQETRSPRCLHQWKPHDGKPMSCLFFLDDHKNLSGDAQFWKYAVTGACNNQELKVWSCESWNCLQTLRFDTTPDVQFDLTLKAGLDLSAKYLVLADKNRMVLYILQIHQDDSGTAAHISSISEFLLAQPCLCFAILSAKSQRLKKSLNDSHLDLITTGDLDGRDEEDDGRGPRLDETTTGVQMKIYSIHPKALQELLIRYKPESSVAPSTPSVGSVSQDDIGLRDTLSDISISIDGHTQDGDAGNVSSIPNDITNTILLTPDAFTTPSPSKASAQNSLMDMRTSGSSTSSFTHVTAMNDDLYTPRSSFVGDHSILSPKDHSILSPSSSVTQTPSSAKVLDTSRSQELTPSNIPLPPIDSVEEEELTTPKSTPKDFDDSTTPNRLITETVNDIFANKPNLPNVSLDSTSSTGGFEVSDMLIPQKVPRKVSEGGEYDENDQEVAEVLGERLPPGEENEVLESFQEEVTDDSAPLQRSWPAPPDVSADPPIVESNGDSCTDDVNKADDGEQDEEDDEPQIEEEIEAVDDEEENGYSSPSVQLTKESMDRETVVKLLTQMEVMTSTLQAQQSQLCVLQQQIAQHQEESGHHHQHMIEHWRLHQLAVHSQPLGLAEHFQNTEEAIGSRIDRVLQETKTLQEGLSHMEQKQRVDEERLHTSIAQSIQLSVSQNLERTVQEEIKRTVGPCITKTMEPLREQLHQDLAQKLTATDSLLKDNIGKMVRSRQTVEAIANAAGNMIQAPIQAAYRESFQNLVVPSFERATQTMFQQVNEAFQRGTAEYTTQLEAHLEHTRQRQQEARDPVIKELQSLVESFRSSSEQIKHDVITTIQNDLASMLQHTLANLQEKTLSHVRAVVKEEVGVAVREHSVNISDQFMNYVRSGAATPVHIATEINPVQSIKTSILSLVRMGSINEAFQQALSASNLDVVMFVCETVNPSDVFGTSPCPLAQPVLLSLISQLSADFSSHIELKVKYLEEAILNLDTLNPVTLEHMTVVLSNMCQKLKLFVSQHPNDKMTRNVKMLIMATQSLLT
ncbi:enhancer of mRNA-decapping protein 4-like isoform X2 [Gigantopelta aegis]|uniref:enhancer of mRNA-decapping protein 4-like isoform X2 n=1 Tax=Gigantopelta aegis TaxID=1735272 RepID=UPI001B88AC76|nr:enhancer of mRNA-decapping protein 4-like isoform X2 [Gigantopelta aegis]